AARRGSAQCSETPTCSRRAFRKPPAGGRRRGPRRWHCRGLWFLPPRADEHAAHRTALFEAAKRGCIEFPMSDVFVSYKREDRARAQFLVAALVAEGLSVWWDVGIEGGSAWRR